MRRLFPSMSAVVAVAGAAAPGATSAAAARPAPVPQTVAAPAVAAPAFEVRYSGSSRTQTSYRATPPNPGGAADLNTARDSSTTTWSLRFPAGVALPACGGEPDPCSAVTGVTGAAGRTTARGRIDHTHVDGLYDQLDATERCSVKARAVPRTGLAASIEVVHDPVAQAFVVTAPNPVSEALLLLPPTCPQRPDGIDRILDNLFTPGFSFGIAHGPDVWLRSAPVSIPDAVWRSSARIRLRLGPTTAGTPPKDCAKRYRYERCTTGGRWSGVLTFTRRG